VPDEPQTAPGSFGAAGAVTSAVVLMRPLNCAMSAFGVLLGARAASPDVDWRLVGFAMACAAVITAGGNTINDYLDAEIDKANHPGRPIPAGRIRRRTAWMLGLGELGLGVGFGFLVNVPCGAIAMAAVGLLLAYEAGGLKNAGLPGNVVISLLTGLLFLTGGAAAGDVIAPLSLGVLACVASIGREIIKDVEDMGGDVTRRTLPMRVGIDQAKKAAAGLIVLAMVLSPWPYLQGTLSGWYLIVVMAANLVFAWSILLLFRRPRGASGAAKLAMLVVLAAFLVGGFA